MTISNENDDDIDEIACGSVDEPDTRRGPKMVIACIASGVCLMCVFLLSLKTNLLCSDKLMISTNMDNEKMPKDWNYRPTADSKQVNTTKCIFNWSWVCAM